MEELQIVDPESSTKAIMKQLASDDPNSIVDVDANKLLDRTKLFLVARARNNLNRIIKLTDFLERLEDKFIESVNTILDNDPIQLQLMVMSMETVSKLLQDANETVVQVLKDEKLQQIVINTTNIITAEGSSATVIDPDSRDSIRNLASSLLAQLSNVQDLTVDDDKLVIDSDKGDNDGV